MAGWIKLKAGGAATRMSGVELIAGVNEVQVHPFTPFDDRVVDFLGKLSRSLLKITKYPDVMTFGYYCRRANIIALKKSFDDSQCRLGRGLIFHITPSNMPVNFAYSFLFGLLSGNANVVRVSSKEYPQTSIICSILDELLADYEQLRLGTSFIRYPHDDQITAYYSSICHGRIIWGGDQTIEDIRKHTIPPRSIDITFADRFSLCVLNSEAIVSLNEQQIKELAHGFYNDTYLIDQNACSSPYLVLWQGSDIMNAQTRFWEAVFEESRRYAISDINAVEKYTQLCCASIDRMELSYAKRYENLVYTLKLDSLPDNMVNLKGKYGFFYEYPFTEWEQIAPLIGTKVQTITYYGIQPESIISIIKQIGLLGIDRIVPVGRALDIGVIWDGMDILRLLSRIIEVK